MKYLLVMKYLSAVFFIFIIYCLTSCRSIPFESGLLTKKFTVSLRSEQVPLGSIAAQFENNFPRRGLRERNVQVIYFPEEDAVCLNYRTTQTYHCFLNREARELFKTALAQYEKDYEEGSLIDRKRRTSSVYGRTEVFIIWELFRFTRQHEMNTDITFGYLYSNRTPYFIVTQMNASYLDTVNREEFRSGEIIMHFTLEQAQALADFFDEEDLRARW